MVNLKTVDLDRLEKLERKIVPNTETKNYILGYFGYFEPKEGYNKLVAYGPQAKSFHISWISKEYLKK